jgi:hypothetical protein
LGNTDFSVYPNPASDKITVSFKNETPRNATLLLVNMNGQVVKQKHLTDLVLGENNVSLNISNLDNGIYSCRVTGNGNVLVSKKLVISH